VKRASKTIFVTEYPSEMTILTLPPFVENPKCGCGKPAEFMLDNMKFICCACIGKQIVNSNYLNKEEDVSIPITRSTVSKIKFDWSTNRSRWYTVYGRGLKPKNWDSFIVKLKDIILNDSTIMFEGEYDKENKEMIIY